MNGTIYITPEILERAKVIEREAAERGADFSVSFGVSICDREKWEKVTSYPGADGILSRAEEILHTEIAQIDDDLYFSADKVGSVEKSKPVQIGLMRDLTGLYMAEGMENKGRFLPKIEEYIRMFCGLRSWVNAGHDRAFGYACYKEGCGLVDLYTSNLTWTLMTCDSCLGDRLSSECRNLLKENVCRRALDVYERKLYGYTDEPIKKDRIPLFWLDVFGNWISVCSGAMTAAALYYGEKEKKALFIAVYEWCMKQYRKSILEGYCVEGLSYWNYGFGHFILGADCVARATGGAVDLYTQGDFALAATFGSDFELSTGDYPSLCDCCYGDKPSVFNLAYHKLRCGEPNAVPEDILREYSGQYVLLLLTFDERFKYSQKGNENHNLRRLYENYQVLICRNRDRSFGACFKGGTNQEPHNHNDLGSFIISVGGESLVADVGHTKYLNDTFGKGRYGEPTLSSFGHSVPVVCGCLQGPEEFICDFFYEEPPFYTKILEKNFSEEKDELLLDLAPAYDCKNLKKLRRQFVFDRNREEVAIIDSFSYEEAESFETAFCTFAEIEQTKDQLILQGKKEKLVVDLPDGCIVTFTPLKGVMVVNEGAGHREEAPIRVGLKLPEKIRNGVVELRFRRR